MHWNEIVPEFEYPSDRVLEYYTILVPNVDNTRTLFLLDLIAKQEKSVLLIGRRKLDISDTFFLTLNISRLRVHNLIPNCI